MGPSMATKIAQAELRTGRRIETVIDRNDDRLQQISAWTLANSMASNTRDTYDKNLRFWLSYCTRQNLSPILDGLNKREDENALIGFALYIFGIQGNKYATIKVKLCAIRSAMMEDRRNI